MIYGDMHKTFAQSSLIPDIHAIRQSGNLYSYTLSNPNIYIDRDAELFLTATALIVGKVVVKKVATKAVVKVVAKPAAKALAKKGLKPAIKGVAKTLAKPLKRGVITGGINAGVSSGAQIIRNVANGNPPFEDVHRAFAKGFITGFATGFASGLPAVQGMHRAQQILTMAAVGGDVQFLTDLAFGDINSMGDAFRSMGLGFISGLATGVSGIFMDSRLRDAVLREFILKEFLNSLTGSTLETIWDRLWDRNSVSDLPSCPSSL
jgi:hypothetical protein